MMYSPDEIRSIEREQRRDAEPGAGEVAPALYWCRRRPSSLQAGAMVGATPLDA